MAMSINKITMPGKMGIKLKYPYIKDPELQKKITLKKEFQYKYDGEIKDILEEEKLGKLSKQGDFTLSPHQEFVKSYINENTPYNGLLLYHGMGSGKTCSAIGITEEYRKANKYNPKRKKIFVVASPNVQENFKLQLFDKKKLEKKNGIWYLGGCVGEPLLSEIKHYDFDKLDAVNVSRKIEKLITQNYFFMGYEKFANRIERILKIEKGNKIKKATNQQYNELNKMFNGCMLVIDEVHNIRMISDKDNKKVANALWNLVQIVKNMKLLFLSGTPMFNDPKEILFITDLLNMNDGNNDLLMRNPSKIFDKNGNLHKSGEQLLISNLNGYVSFVRGENPYSFPFKIYPKDYKDARSIQSYNYPKFQFNNKKIESGLLFLDLYMNNLGELQQLGYNKIIESIYDKFQKNSESKFENMDSFGYNVLQEPLKMLNMCYTLTGEEEEDNEYNTGNTGLSSIMKYEENGKEYQKYNFEYKVNEKVFRHENIGKYSAKIKSIMDCVMKSEGIVLIYSQYLDAGIIPCALALEELGFKRCSHNNLLKPRDDIKKLNSINMSYEPDEEGNFKQCKYAMITGDKMHSLNNNDEIATLNSIGNVMGHMCKVVFITQAGSEGIDFKNLRQVHVMEPWYNLNRIEQVIGRAIRNYGHKDLELKKRNCQIFLHGTYIDERTEAMDLMVYRYIEKKSQKIGKVQKLLKSISVDCLLNYEQINFFKEMKQEIEIELSNKTVISYNLKDKPFSSICDYSDQCDYTCSTNINGENIDNTTYDYNHLHSASLIKKIKNLFTKSFVYNERELYDLLKTRNHQSENIEYAMNYIIEHEEYLVDRYLRKGKLIKIKNLFVFQPIELEDEIASIFDYKRPVKFTKSKINKAISNMSEHHNSIVNEENTTNAANSVKVKTTEKINSLLEDIKQKIELSVDIDIETPNEDQYISKLKEIGDLINTINIIQVNDIDLKKICCDIIFNSLKENDEIALLKYYLTNEDTLNEYEELMFSKMKGFIYEQNGVEIYSTIDLNISEPIIKHFTIKKQDKIVTIHRSTPNDIYMFGSIEHLKIPIEVNKHKIITFMQQYSKTNEIKIKTRDIEGNKKNKGAVFENKSVKDKFPIINNIFKKITQTMFENIEVIKKEGKYIKFGNEKIKLDNNGWDMLLLVCAFMMNDAQDVYYLDKVLYHYNL